MSDIRDPADPIDMSDDEIAALQRLGFELEKNFNDYGNGDLLAALRYGYQLGLRDERTER